MAGESDKIEAARLSDDDRAALRHTQYSAWYVKYSRSAFKSAIIDLPDDFVDYLLEDGVVVGDASRAVSVFAVV